MLPLILLLAPVTPSVQVDAATDSTRVVVTAVLTDKRSADLPVGALTQEQGESRLRFCLIDPDSGKEGDSILGTYKRAQEKLTFVPRHPLTPGQRYRATLDLGAGKTATVEYRAPMAAPAPPPTVEKVYPSTDVLPANQLKFYLHFSKPMRETREIFDQIRILDEKGKPINDPWRRTELWSVDGKRLTLWIHPGRIKQGIGPNETEGPVLFADRQYTLVIGAEVAEAGGTPLGKPFRKTFRTVKEKRTRPLPEKWTLRPAKADTRRPLIVEFPDPLDRALLDRFLVVQDRNGKRIPGRIEVGKEERSWAFHPDRAWEDSEYKLVVDEQLEDLAGNTPVQVFDADLTQPLPILPRLTLRFRPGS